MVQKQLTHWWPRAAVLWDLLSRESGEQALERVLPRSALLFSVKEVRGAWLAQLIKCLL